MRLFLCFAVLAVCVQCGKDPNKKKKETRKEEKLRHEREDDDYARRRAAELGNSSSRADAFVASCPVPDTSSFLASLLPLAVAPPPVPVTLPALVLPEARNVVKADLDKAFRLAKLGAASNQEVGIAQCSSRTTQGMLRTDTGLLVTTETLQPRTRAWSTFSSESSVGSVPALSEDSVGQLGEPRYWQTYPEFEVTTPDSSVITVVDLVSPVPSVAGEQESIVDLGSVVDVDISEDIRPIIAQPEVVIPTEVGTSVDVDICEDIRPVVCQLGIVSPTEEVTVEEVVEEVVVSVQAAAVVVHMESNDHIPPNPAVVVCSVVPLSPVVGPSSSAAVLSTGLTSVSSILSPVPSPAIGKYFIKIFDTISCFLSKVD